MKFSYISNILIIAIICTWNIYINNKIIEFKRDEYFWKKLLGMSEKSILFDFKKNNILVECCVLLIFGGISITYNFGWWIISLLNFVLLLNNMIMLVFRKKYRENLIGKLFTIAMNTYYIYLFYTFIQAIIFGTNSYEISMYITKSFAVRGIAEIIKKPSAIMFLTNVLLYTYLFATLPQYNDRVYLNKTKKQIKFSFVMPENTVMLLIVYAGNIFLAINISHNENIFSMITCALTVLLGGTIDQNFHQDTCNKQWYRLLGEKYSVFWRKKMRVEIIIQFTIVVTYFICAIIQKYSINTVCITIFYFIVCSICWVSYFASYFVNMQRTYNWLEMIKLYVVMIVIAIPGLNLLLGICWNMQGCRRWKKYVRDL